jgi:hypothetical protein
MRWEGYEACIREVEKHTQKINRKTKTRVIPRRRWEENTNTDLKTHNMRAWAEFNRLGAGPSGELQNDNGL